MDVVEILNFTPPQKSPSFKSAWRGPDLLVLLAPSRCAHPGREIPLQVLLKEGLF